MQLISDLTQKSIIRMPSPDMSAIGVALMAGIEQGTTTYSVALQLMIEAA